MPTVLVSGASQGLGLELARQYAADGWRVIATCRSPDAAPELAGLAGKQVIVERMDVTDAAGVQALARRYADQPIDLLLNNAGIMGALPFRENLHRQHFGSIDYELWDQVFRTNTLGTVRVTEAFVGSVAMSAMKKIVCLSSTTGSISESRREALAYTTSKTALNKAMTLIAERLRPQGIVVSLVCPGYVMTRMNVGGATLGIPESVSRMRRLIEGLTLADSGTFRRYNGETIAW